MDVSWAAWTPEELLRTKARSKPRKSKYGGIINDCPHSICLDGGKAWRPYMLWYNLAIKCYGERATQHHMDDRWLRFTNFLEWAVQSGNMERCLDSNMRLNNQLLKPKSDTYSPETTVLVPKMVDKLFAIPARDKLGDCILGVTFHPDCCYRPYFAKRSNVLTGKTEFIGSFATELEAHLAWHKRKKEYLNELIDAGYFDGLPDICKENAHYLIDEQSKDAISNLNGKS